MNIDPPREHKDVPDAGRDPGGESRGWRDEDEIRDEGAAAPEGEMLSTTVSAEVRAIFEAAERSAEEIKRQSERKAKAISEAATERARQIRSEAVDQARQELAGISQGTDDLIQDLENRIRELASLVEGLRSDADRLVGDLTQLERVGEPAPPPVAAVPEPEPEPDAAEATAEGRAAIRATAPFAGEPDEARLLALNMALNGAPRVEIERYLSENFDLEDPEQLVDAVYRRVGR